MLMYLSALVALNWPVGAISSKPSAVQAGLLKNVRFFYCQTLGTGSSVNSNRFHGDMVLDALIHSKWLIAFLTQIAKALVTLDPNPSLRRLMPLQALFWSSEIVGSCILR